MEIDVPTFLVTVYSTVDDIYKERFAPHKPVRPGPEVEMSDSEVLTLVLLAQWRPDRSESGFLRLVAQRWRAYFPRLLSQSAFNRRARDLAGVLCALGPLVSQVVAHRLGLVAAYETLDGVPVPLMRRCRGERHRLFANEAAVGRGGSDRDWYYGVKLLCAVTAHGLISGFVVGPANTEERWLADALLRWRVAPTAPAPSAAALAPVLDTLPYHQRPRQGPTGPLAPRLGAGVVPASPYVADLGFRGAAWRQHWAQDYGATVLTRDDYGSIPAAALRSAACRWLASQRQVGETLNALLCERFGLKFPRARSWWGVLARLGAKMAACNLAIYLNYLLDRPPFALFAVFD